MLAETPSAAADSASERLFGASAETGLARGLSFRDCVALVIGSVIGSGIFLVTSNIAAYVRTPAMVLAVWVVGGVLSIVGGLTFGELGARVPEAGGQYVYLKRAFGPLVAFLYGWTLLLVIQSGSIAAICVAFGQYLGVLVPLGGPDGVTLAAVAAIVALTVVNALGTRAGVAVQNLFTLAKCSALAALILLVFGTGQGRGDSYFPILPEPIPDGFLASLGLAVVAALWAYDGWNNLTFVAGEIERPERNLPLALIGGVLVVTAFYVAASAAYLAVLPVTEVAASERIAADVAGTILGPKGRLLISAAIVISSIGCANGLMLSGPRVTFAMARDGVFLPALAQVHPVTGTPLRAIVLQGSWACVLTAWGRYDQLFNYVMFIAWLFYGLTALALFYERRAHPDYVGYRAPGYPFTPGLFALATVLLVANTICERPGESLMGLAMLASGVPVYFFARRRGRPGKSGTLVVN